MSVSRSFMVGEYSSTLPFLRDESLLMDLAMTDPSEELSLLSLEVILRTNMEDLLFTLLD